MRWPTVALDVEQQRDQSAGARHLREQVEERHDQRGGRRRHAHRALLEPEAQHVGHREPAGVAEQFGDQQQCDQPGDQEADRVEEAVVAVDGDRAGDAEEGGRRQVVARDRDAVLRPGERAARRVVVGAVLLLRLARNTMISVMTTNATKMPMLAAGLPTVSAGGQHVGCPLTSAVALHLGADRSAARVEFAVGVPHVDAGDDERRHELPRPMSRPTLMLPKPWSP